MRTYLTTALGFFMIAIGSLSAQDISTSDNLRLEFINELSNSNETIIEEDWSFFQDEENQLYLIDFETIPFNISEVVVSSVDRKDIIWEESVFDLPVDAIYEIDYSKFPSGSYQLELRTINGILAKSIRVD